MPDYRPTLADLHALDSSASDPAELVARVTALLAAAGLQGDGPLKG